MIPNASSETIRSLNINYFHKSKFAEINKVRTIIFELIFWKKSASIIVIQHYVIKIICNRPDCSTGKEPLVIFLIGSILGRFKIFLIWGWFGSALNPLWLKDECRHITVKNGLSWEDWCPDRAFSWLWLSFADAKDAWVWNMDWKMEV